MNSDDSLDYGKVKEAILEKFEINEEVYRRRFREPDIKTGETPKELYHRLKDLFRKWIRPEQKTVEDVGETLILEQFLRTLAPDIRVWVKEHRPQTGQQAAELVENFVSARRGSKNFRAELAPRPVVRGKTDWSGGGGGPRVSDRGRVGERSTYTTPRFTTAPKERPSHSAPDRIVCYQCGQEGHIKPDCPVRKSKGTGQCCFPGLDEQELGFMGRLQTVTVFVGGKETSALLDTGSSQTLVRPYLVDKQDYSGKMLTLKAPGYFFFKLLDLGSKI